MFGRDTELNELILLRELLTKIEMETFDTNVKLQALLDWQKGQAADELAVLNKILVVLQAQPVVLPAVVLRLTQILEGKEITGMVNLTDIQKYTVGIKDELDAKGNPVQSAGPFTFVLSDTTFGTLTPSADGLSADFAAGGKLGAGFITATDSSNQLQGVSNFTVGPSAPVTLELNESTPVAQ